FDQQIRPVSGGTTVVDAAGKSVMDGPAANAPGNLKQLVVPLRQGLPAGDYTVRWEIVSTHGHLIAGVYAFGVRTRGPPPPGGPRRPRPAGGAAGRAPRLAVPDRALLLLRRPADAGRRRRLPRGRLPAGHRRRYRRTAAADGAARTSPREPGAGVIGGAGAGR